VKVSGHAIDERDATRCVSEDSLKQSERHNGLIPFRERCISSSFIFDRAPIGLPSRNARNASVFDASSGGSVKKSFVKDAGDVRRLGAHNSRANKISRWCLTF